MGRWDWLKRVRELSNARLAKLQDDSFRVIFRNELEVLHRGVGHPATEIQAECAQLQTSCKINFQCIQSLVVSYEAYFLHIRSFANQ